ncbi:NAD(P)-dependent oxidoreductase [Amycolatopsis sp. NPDC059657]|uniref:NAD(P)-dependent oxidoreductase n=1 Tax=Amycolatopsis sp. NPDC059657 TaxID=3346899 RepID=UPI00366E8F54
MRVLVSSEPDDEAGAKLLAELPEVEVIRYDPTAEQLDAEQRTAHVLIPPYRGSHRPIRLLTQLPDLVHVQLLTAGADEWSGDVPADIQLATARGAVVGPVSEWVLSAALTLYRQWPNLVRYQDTGTWAHRRPGTAAETVAGKKVLIIGAGAIGMGVADKLAPFDAQTTLVASTARGPVHSPDALPDLLPQHQIVVLTLPLTAETTGMVDAKFLAAMPDDALLINASRGRIVDTAALVNELSTGRIRAALDVTDPEPLPADHPLWTCPGVIISPHMARTVPGTNRLCYAVAAEQIKEVIFGGTPTNVVTTRRTK